jgi:hypothetical protein
MLNQSPGNCSNATHLHRILLFTDNAAESARAYLNLQQVKSPGGQDIDGNVQHTIHSCGLRGSKLNR